MIHLLGTVSVLAGGVAATLFVVLYHLSARWWTSEEGRHLMSFTFVMAAVLDYVSVRTMVGGSRPPSLGVDVPRFVIFGLVAVLLIWRLLMLYRIQIRPRARRR